MKGEAQYLKLLNRLLKTKNKGKNRTDTDSFSIFGEQMRFDLRKGFPLITTKKVHWKSVVIELLWLMRGETNIAFLKKHNVRIWNEWADENGDLGPVYGKQWRRWDSKSIGEIDQLKLIIERIKTNPECRRLIVSSWNVGELPEMALPPCHSFFQFNVTNGRLDLQLYQRSADMFLGVPFNIASYSLLLHLVAHECGLEVGEFIHTLGNYHLYENHRDQAEIQVKRKPLPLPSLKICIRRGDLFKFIDELSTNMSWQDIQNYIVLENYQSHEKIEGKVSV